MHAAGGCDSYHYMCENSGVSLRACVYAAARWTTGLPIWTTSSHSLHLPTHSHSLQPQPFATEGVPAADGVQAAVHAGMWPVVYFGSVFSIYVFDMFFGSSKFFGFSYLFKLDLFTSVCPFAYLFFSSCALIGR
jgi:hypothetical protein